MWMEIVKKREALNFKTKIIPMNSEHFSILST